VESDLFYDVLNKVDPCEAYCEKTYPGISVPNVSSDLPLLLKLRCFHSLLTHPLTGSKSQPYSFHRIFDTVINMPVRVLYLRCHKINLSIG
jgi:hypothetical protein